MLNNQNGTPVVEVDCPLFPPASNASTVREDDEILSNTSDSKGCDGGDSDNDGYDLNKDYGDDESELVQDNNSIVAEDNRSQITTRNDSTNIEYNQESHKTPVSIVQEKQCVNDTSDGRLVDNMENVSVGKKAKKVKEKIRQNKNQEVGKTASTVITRDEATVEKAKSAAGNEGEKEEREPQQAKKKKNKRIEKYLCASHFIFPMDWKIEKIGAAQGKEAEKPCDKHCLPLYYEKEHCLVIAFLSKINILKGAKPGTKTYERLTGDKAPREVSFQLNPSSKSPDGIIRVPIIASQEEEKKAQLEERRKVFEEYNETTQKGAITSNGYLLSKGLELLPSKNEVSKKRQTREMDSSEKHDEKRECKKIKIAKNEGEVKRKTGEASTSYKEASIKKANVKKASVKASVKASEPKIEKRIGKIS